MIKRFVVTFIATAIMCRIHSHIRSASRLRTTFADFWSLKGNTILIGASHLSATWACESSDTLDSMNWRMVDCTRSKVSEDSHTQVADKREAPIRIVLPFKDQKSANVVRKQLADLSRKINADISPVYTSRKIKDEIKVKEEKPPLVS